MNKQFNDKHFPHPISECGYRKTINSNLENRIEKRKNFDFVQRKENAICSLFEVEHFLSSIHKVLHTFKFYNSIKK